MSDSRPTTAADNNNEGQVIVDWAQVPNVRGQRGRELRLRRQHGRLRRRVCKEEERWEAKHKCKAEARKGSEAVASGSEASKVKKVVMDPGCTHCSQANVVCKFLIDSNKKQVACIWCNLLKGKCWWPGDGKDAEGKVDKGKNQKVNDEGIEAGPSKQKQAKTSVRPVEVLDLDEPEPGGSRSQETDAEHYSGLEEKLEYLIDAVGLIANNLASLFKLHKTAVENSGCIADMLKSLLDESYGFRMAVPPSDLGLSELDSDELHEEADWLKAHGKDEEEESGGEDETMAEAK
ncbi:hypothetical protein M404DRAFT_33250 [Pisolithus tinctorius Marx 270]|uniref:Uncharacterized protein n=1 Tax=Pisolithus tinctorius Marx 270 TaxID=870435 RepID=A0A0C3JFQ6_PISTI|nr:hypothetical protein M404DRAFT_33250 [Pisolithus tinctorius Marx 270]